MAELRRRGRPQSERAVYVETGTMFVRELPDLRERVRRSRVHLSRLADDGRPVADGENVTQRLCIHATLIVGRNTLHASPAEPEHLEGRQDSRVHRISYDDRDRRCACETLLFHVDAHASQHRTTAAASAVKVAMVAPVVKPTLVPAGNPSNSTSQPAATSSATEPAGDAAYVHAFWSQVEVSQSAATVAGSAPPMTKPK